MAKITMVTGGTRSGKSSFAEQLCTQTLGRIAYIATAQPFDDEMTIRIEQHQERRGERWENFECPLGIQEIHAQLTPYDAILIDCMTMLILNYMFTLGVDFDHSDAITKEEYRRIEESTLQFVVSYLEDVGKLKGKIIFVTNEIGLGIVPDNWFGRVYRDIIGKANQLLAEASSEAYLVISGIPLKIKGT